MSARASAAADRFFDRAMPRDATVARLDGLARLLDSAVRIPGTNVRLGLDAVVGLIPGVGDVASTVLSAYLILEARRAGLPMTAVARMIGNVAMDAAIGWIPLVGDVFDVFFRANLRNMRILREHVATRAAAPR